MLAHARREGVRGIARLNGQDPSVISRELARDSSKLGHRAVTAQQHRMDTEPALDTRVLHDLVRGCTPRQITGRLKLEAGSQSVEPMEGSLLVGGEHISHEAPYTWIYALPKSEIARLGVVLPSRCGASAVPGRFGTFRVLWGGDQIVEQIRHGGPVPSGAW